MDTFTELSHVPRCPLQDGVLPVVGRHPAGVVDVSRQQHVDALHQVERLPQPLPAGVLQGTLQIRIRNKLRKVGKLKNARVCVRTHPCLEKLVVDLKEARQLHTDLLHGDRDEAHVPVQTTHFLLQELDQKLCSKKAVSWQKNNTKQT